MAPERQCPKREGGEGRATRESTEESCKEEIECLLPYHNQATVSTTKAGPGGGQVGEEDKLGIEFKAYLIR